MRKGFASTHEYSDTAVYHPQAQVVAGATGVGAHQAPAVVLHLLLRPSRRLSDVDVEFVVLVRRKPAVHAVRQSVHDSPPQIAQSSVLMLLSLGICPRRHVLLVRRVTERAHAEDARGIDARSNHLKRHSVHHLKWRCALSDSMPCMCPLPRKHSPGLIGAVTIARIQNG
jgi:hypothetical protein